MSAAVLRRNRRYGPHGTPVRYHLPVSPVLLAGRTFLSLPTLTDRQACCPRLETTPHLVFSIMSDALSGTFPRSPQAEPTAIIPLGKPTVPGRRHSSSFSSMDAQYRALPQSPDAAQDLGIPSAIEDVDESILDDSEHVPSSEPVDGRVQWIHFMLGAAVLLPWNGTPRGIS